MHSKPLNWLFHTENHSSVSLMKLLDATFTDQLPSNHHANIKLKTASCLLGVLYRPRRIFPLASMLQLIKALIRSHFEYFPTFLPRR
jgi:hypothetical protein